MTRIPALRSHLRLFGRDGDDAERSRRVDAVMQIVEHFVFDLGLLSAGTEVDLDAYVEPAVASRMRDAVRPAIGGALTTRPDFGEFAQVRIEDGLIEPDVPVRTVVELDDRSTRVDTQGRTVTRLHRRLRLLLLLDPSITRVIDHRLEVA